MLLRVDRIEGDAGRGEIPIPLGPDDVPRRLLILRAALPTLEGESNSYSPGVKEIPAKKADASPTDIRTEGFHAPIPWGNDHGAKLDADSAVFPTLDHRSIVDVLPRSVNGFASTTLVQASPMGNLLV